MPHQASLYNQDRTWPNSRSHPSSRPGSQPSFLYTVSEAALQDALKAHVTALSTLGEGDSWGTQSKSQCHSPWDSRCMGSRVHPGAGNAALAPSRPSSFTENPRDEMCPQTQDLAHFMGRGRGRTREHPSSSPPVQACGAS